MKYSNYILTAAVALFVLASCDKTKEPAYQPAAPNADTEQVFFPGSMADQVIMSLEDVSFNIPIYRGAANKEAVDVAIAANGDGLEYFSVPGEVSFASGASTANLVVSVKDADAMTVGKFYELTLAIADEAFTTPYGRNKVTITAGYDFPWIKFDKGVFYESWNEVEVDQTMEYQQISENMRRCRIENYMADDDDEGITLYWYWNTTTNTCFIPPTILGAYDGENNVVCSDMAAFYTMYMEWDKEPDVGPIGTDIWYAWADKWMTNRNARPYYDGNGTFHLADWFYIASNSTGIPTGRGWMFGGGEGDWFKGNSFGDYTLTVSYDGMLVDTEDNATPIVTFANTKKSAKYFSDVKYVITDQKTDPVATLALIAEGKSEEIQTVKIKDGKTSAYPAIEPGLYRLVAVPYVAGDKDDEGNSTAVKTAFAQTIDFYFPGMNVAPKEVEGDLLVMDIDEVVDPKVCEAQGYFHYNSFGYAILGTEIKSGLIGMWKTSITNAYPIETLLENCTALKDSQIDAINENGYYANGFINLDAETSYTMIVELTNVYGATKVFTATYVTAAMPYSGELVIGDYVMMDNEGYENYFTVVPGTEDNIFMVKDLILGGNGDWYAAYDPEKHTLTLDGSVKGYEQYGNLFGAGLYYYDDDHTMYYATYVFDNENSEGNDELVFSVDPETKELNMVNQTIDIAVFANEDDSYLGSYAVIEAGTAVSPYVDNEEAPARRSIRSIKKVRNGNMAPAKKASFAPLKSYAAEGVNDNVNVIFSARKSMAPSQEVIYSTPVYGHKNSMVLRDFEPVENIQF